MLAQAPVIGFIPVTDFGIAEAFYSGPLGLPVAGRDDFALVLAAASGVMIRCVKAPAFTPQPFTIFGWESNNLQADAARLVAAGISPIRFSWFQQDSHGIWTAPDGTRVLWFLDPFGNTLSLSCHASSQGGGVPAP